MSGAFAQITSGPATASGNNTNEQALILDKTSNIVESVGVAGLAQALQTALYIFNAQAALTNVTTAQNLINKTLNPGVLNKLGRTFLISVDLIYTTPGTTTPAMTFALVIGGVTVCSITIGAASATASTNMPIQLQFTITTASTGAAGTLESHGFVQANLTGNTPAAAITGYNDTNAAPSAAINLTQAQALQVQVSANSAVSSVQVRFASVEVTF